MFPCSECEKRFTRSENLERHLRSSHTATSTFVCDRCGRTFARSDVRKRHAQRCARGLHRRQQRTAVTDLADNDHGAPVDVSPGTDQNNVTGTAKDSEPADDVLGVGNGGTGIRPLGAPLGGTFDQYALPMIDTQPVTPMNGLLSPGDERFELPSAHAFTSAIASSCAACYFQHFHPFLPIIHTATFRLSTAPDVLCSIVVAIGRGYLSDKGDEDWSAETIWRRGVDQLLSMMRNDSELVRKPCYLQAWLLHVVYGFYFATDSSSASRNMLHILVDQMRTMCLLKQGLTFPEHESWTSSLNSPETLKNTWSAYVHQESFRLCILALLFVDLQIATPCNLRPLLSTTEVIWDIPYTGLLCNATSADEWVTTVLEEVQIGNIVCTSTMTNHIRNQDLLHPAMVLQFLMSGSASSRLLERMSSNAFGTVCVLASLEALVRDFTYCYYQMPPVLPDPSAFHILAPDQNRSINAAVRTILDNVVQGTICTAQVNRLMQLMTWTVRLGLSEPDDLLVAGIADTSLAAGLATSTHCMLGSVVATRRAAPLRHRPFGEDSSLICWQDLLSSLDLLTESSQDTVCQQPPWMTALGYRLLLILWRTLRKANVDLDLPSGSLNPARLITPLITERVKSCLRNDHGRPDYDLVGPGVLEPAFMSLLEQIFGDVKSPVGTTIISILSEVEDLLVSMNDAMTNRC